MKLKFSHLAVVTSLLSLSLFSASPSLARPRNVISSCRAYSPTAIVGSGRCIIRTRIEGDYIMVRVETPWQHNDGVDQMRLENDPSCTHWSYVLDRCRGAFWYGEGDGWNFVSAGEREENGQPKFSYTVGNAYAVVYDGEFPRP